MREFCQIFIMNIKKTLSFIFIVCLIWNLSLSAEGISVKLRGKLALAGILSSVAILTHTLVKRDTKAAEAIQSQLGSTEQVLQIEHGFNRWEVHHYRGYSYYFLNNRFIRKKATETFFLKQTSLDNMRRDILTYSSSSWGESFSAFLNDKPVSVNPKWWSLSLLRQQPTLVSVSPYLHLLEVEPLHFLHHWRLHLK